MKTLDCFDFDPNWSENVPKPKSLSKSEPFYEDKLLMIPGPTNLGSKVQQELSRSILSHTDPQFHQLLGEIQDGLRYLFQTKNSHTFALTGSATLAMECALCNFLSPRQSLLSLVHGYWGERIATMAERLGFKAYRLRSQFFGENFTLDRIENALRRFRPSMLYVCHCDSSIGFVQNLQGIGQLCHRYDCLLLVDAVVSLCTTPLSMDRWDIDILFSGAQKALSGPPGLALISFSQKAIDRLPQKDGRSCRSFYLDIKLIAKSWGIDDQRSFTYHYTPAINLLFGLRAAIVAVIDESLKSIVRRHRNVRDCLENELQKLDLKFLIENPSNRSAGITSVLIPNDIDGSKVMESLSKNDNILIGGSLLRPNSAANIPKFWRFGYLGVNADCRKIKLLVRGLRNALIDQRKLRAHL
uniref:Alanine--glyoxylate aminotransferase n=1 Tax=Sarcoptes scabiei TaxID=52283 RepID=A0A834R9I0_SARSC